MGGQKYLGTLYLLLNFAVKVKMLFKKNDVYKKKKSSELSQYICYMAILQLVWGKWTLLLSRVIIK